MEEKKATKDTIQQNKKNAAAPAENAGSSGAAAEPAGDRAASGAAVYEPAGENVSADIALREAGAVRDAAGDPAEGKAPAGTTLRAEAAKETSPVNETDSQAHAAAPEDPDKSRDEKLQAELAAVMGAAIPEEAGEGGEAYAGGAEAAEPSEGGTGEKEAGETEAGQTGLPEDHAGMGETGTAAEHPEMSAIRERIEQRRRLKERKKRRFRVRFYFITGTLVLITGVLVLSVSGFFTVDSIEVKGNSHFTAEEIINMGHAVPGRNLIYNPGKAETEQYLEQNPYIKKAEVSRKLPSTLVITVSERSEKFTFAYDNDYLVMDEDGILLKKTRNKPKITLVEGAVVNKIKLGEKIGTENSRLTDKAIKILKTMTKSDLYFVRLDVSKEKMVRAYVYDTLVVRADYDTLMESMKNGRLHMVLEKLLDEGIERGTISFIDDGTASFMPVIQ